MTGENVLTVSELNQYLKNIFDRDRSLNGVCVQGEISNYKVYPSGHHYFTLKDPEGSLRCVLFKASAIRLRFMPENGMKVLAFGRVTVFPRDGAYQLYCTQLTPAGAGDLHVAFEQMKLKLQQEGLFDPQQKKALPKFPMRIAIVTSEAGAAVHDMLRILRKRFPLTTVYLLSVRVQGIEAPPEICGAIRYINRFKLADVIIAGRGGGSIEDLWAFNDERLARTIYMSDIPVVSAVGHEPDVTISDYVADLRAATPSNAAELVVPDQIELRDRLSVLQSRMEQAVRRKLTLSGQQLENLRSKRVLLNPINYLQDRRLLLDYQQKQLVICIERIMERKKSSFSELTASLDAMSPLKVLSRGYSMTQNAVGAIISDVSALQLGETVKVSLRSGSFSASVIEIKDDKDV